MGSTSSVSSPITFSGSSSYASSFQQVLQRAVSIASLPMEQLQTAVGTFQAQQSDLSSLQATFSSLQNSLQDIASAANGAVTASSANTTIVTANAATGTLPGTYSVEVDDVGSSTSTISSAGTPPVTDPTASNISSSSTYTLTVNNTPYHLSLSSNTLENLATAINQSAAGVSATIVNLGSNSSPDYRLSVTSNNLGGDSIDLSVGTTSLLTTQHTGTPALYKVNGNSTQLSSTSDQVTLAPGLTATLVANDVGNPINITVSASNTALSSALSNFADAYNSAVSALATQRGQNGGSLGGESIVYTLTDALNQIANFAGGSGATQALSAIGLDLDSTGNISFNASEFNSQSASVISQFLGDINSSGFLQFANTTLTSVADPTDGVIASQLNTLSGEISNENLQIADEQSRIDDMQSSLTEQLSQADASIAVLEQQKTYYTDLFAAEYLNNNVNSTSGG